MELLGFVRLSQIRFAIQFSEPILIERVIMIVKINADKIINDHNDHKKNLRAMVGYYFRTGKIILLTAF